jgi:hypothetical protein
MNLDQVPDPVSVAERDDDLLTRAEASEFLKRFGIRMKPATLARLWSTGGDGPACRHIRGKPFYPRDVLRTWAERQDTGLRHSAHDAAGRGGAHGSRAD